MQSDDDDPSTLFLKRPRFTGDRRQAEDLTMAGKLTCLDSQLLLSEPAASVHWLIRNEEVIGRGDDCTIVINSPELSRRHAPFSAYSNQWVVEDCDSRNGVWLNNTRVERRQTITNGDTIRFGRIAFRFEVFPMTAAAVAEQVSASHKSIPASRGQSLQDTVSVDLSASPADDDETSGSKLRAQAEAFGVAVDGDSGVESSLRSLREAFPGIIETLLEKARDGDVDAAKACVDILAGETRRLPSDIHLKGTIAEQVRQVLCAISDHKIDPAQALAILQSFATATKLLRQDQDGLQD